MEKVDSKKLREFGLLTGLVFVLLFGLFIPWLKSKSYPLWPWVLALLLWIPAILKPMVLGPVYDAWMKIGHALGWINSRIILGAVFYLLITPMGWVMRRLGKNPLGASAQKSDSNSYRVVIKKREEKHMEVPY